MIKKEAALTLFDAGHSPFSPEVKAINVKVQARVNYYWEQKRGGGEAVGGIDEIRHMKKEAKSPGREAIPEEELEPEEAKPQGEVGPEEAKVKDRAQPPILFRFTFLHFSFTFL